MFCEKPVGGTPRQTVTAERVARHAGVITGVGYNYRWAPLVQYAKQLIDSGALGEITNPSGTPPPRGLAFSKVGITSAPGGVKVGRRVGVNCGIKAATRVGSRVAVVAGVGVGGASTIGRLAFAVRLTSGA